MGRASRRKNVVSSKDLKAGEIVKLRSLFGIPPYGVYKVEGVNGEMLYLSAGSISLGADLKWVQIVERGLMEPKSWLHSEIAVIKANLDLSECPHCRRLLAECEEKLKAEGLSLEGHQLH
ncbi:MAG: hypothetical protein GYA55_00685 [SAR324 cluster bacterium]|uniref:Uncharacterized protein n=1 Tax=SAR324 cluster bacterium TaxID=2024889 RepID=A0A7X9IIJ3_9DELT|nr:hypothetical protein [SAR324 cluster bacterium]